MLFGTSLPKNGSQNERGGLAEVFVQKEFQQKMLEFSLRMPPTGKGLFQFPILPEN